jgi:hypothetical protein
MSASKARFSFFNRHITEIPANALRPIYAFGAKLVA